MASAQSRVRWAAVPAALAAILAAAGIGAEPEAARPSDESVVEGSPAGDWGFLYTPPFPGREITEAIRADFSTLIAPEARAGSAHVTHVRPQLGLSLSGPASDRLVLRVAGSAATSLYRFHGDPTGMPSLLSDLDLYAARLSLEGAYRADVGPWFAEDEIWSVLGSLAGSARWEDGDFLSGLGATASLGFGYEIPDRLRVGLGVSLRTSLEQGGLDPGPFFSLRWDVTDRFTVRTHDLGLRLEYRLTPALELHATGARASDSFRLDDRAGVHDDLTFRDRYLRVGAGVDWTLANWLRLDLEVGGTAERRLRVSGDDLGTLVSQRVDPSVYFVARLELRL